jgi:uncharacterized protein YndB with AHSA1/START domain
MVVIGWIFTLLPAAALIMSGILKLTKFKPPEGSPDIGWPESIFVGLAMVEIGCTVLYLFPRTAALGAILLTGYLGGAVSAHVRIGDVFFIPIILGVFVWLGLFFRDARVRVLVPIRSYPWENAGEVGFVGVPKTIGFALAGIIVAALGLVVVVCGLAAVQPDEYQVSRSATINAPPSAVFPHVNDFHQWNAWSPWLKPDPVAKVTYEGSPSGEGAVYKWSSDKQAVGKGTMTLTESKEYERIKIKLDFLEPMEGTGTATFTFEPVGDQTKVTWTMNGRQGYAGKAFGLIMNMDKMIGDRFDEGLANLKAVVEAANKK